MLYGLTVDNTRGLAVEGHLEELPFDGALTVDGLADSVDDASQQSLADTQGGDAFGALHCVAFVDSAHLAQHHHTHIVLLEVLYNALFAGSELYEFATLGVVQSVDTGNTVTNGEHGPHLFELHVEVYFRQLFLQYCRYFGRFDI